MPEYVKRNGTFCYKWDTKPGASDIPEDLIPMWVADMDFKVFDGIAKALAERVNHGVFGYTFTPREYFESIADWWHRRHDIDVDPSWIVHVPGVVSGIAVSLLTFTKPGDGIVIQPPVYWSFFRTIEENSRRIVENPLKRIGRRYVMDLEDLRAKLVNSKVFLLCSPHNPVGRVWKEEELKDLSDVLSSWDGLIISDEIHMDFVFSGKFFSMLEMKGVLDRLIVLSSPSKTFNISGLKGGYAVIPNRKLREEFEKTLRALHISSPNTMIVHATTVAYREGERWLEETLTHIRENMILVKRELENLGIGVELPEGTYLMWLDFRNTPLKDPFTEILKRGVWLQKGECFGENGKGFLRMNVATDREILREALKRIKTAFQI